MTKGTFSIRDRLRAYRDTLRSCRCGRWLVSALLISTGAGLLALSGGLGVGILSPGALSESHAAVDECRQCHVSLEKGFVSLRSAIFSADTPARNSNLCLSCHQFGDLALKPHGLDNHSLLAIANKEKKSRSSPAAALNAKVAQSLNVYDADTPIPCSVCHKEHQGERALKGNQDAFCQSCHKTHIDSFNKDHPEWDSYPYDKDPNFRFNHGQHFVKHFADKKYKSHAKKFCNDCHETEKTRKVTLRGFSESCGDCHSKRIYGDNTNKNSVAFLSLPGIDVNAMKDAGRNIGYWPEDSEAEVTPFMELMLMSDEGFLKIKDKIAKLDLLDLSNAEPDELQAVEEFAWAVKSLIYDLSAESGVAGMALRFEKVFNRKFTTTERASLSALISADSLKLAMHSWFPDLASEMNAFTSGVKPGTSMEAKFSPLAALGDIPRVEGWYRDDFILYYKLTGHADDFVRSWLEITIDHLPDSSQATDDILSSLADKKSPGGCLKCHSIVTDQKGRKKIEWSARLGNADHALVQFDHSPHYSIMGNKDCALCHEVEKQKDEANFKPMQKKVCAQCHNDKNVSQNCTSCHQYHGKKPGHQYRIQQDKHNLTAIAQ